LAANVDSVPLCPSDAVPDFSPEYLQEMTHIFGLIGAPSSAGAHYLGQEQSPAALRAAGLTERLTAAGISLVDYGDLPLVRCRVDRTTVQAQTLAQVQAVASRLADYVEKIVYAEHIPLVIGGDCTITLGVLAGVIRQRPDLALLYFDGGMDVATPATYRLAMLDSMGVAHLVAEPGSAPMLTHLGPRYSLMAGRDIVPFGYIPGEPAAIEKAFLARHDMSGYPISTVHRRARQAATEARARLETQAERFVVHFDVDVIDFLDFPAADVVQPQQGLTFAETLAALQVFCASPKFAGLVITEFNPDHDDQNGTLAKRLIDCLAQVLQQGGFAQPAC
jgi:arginase